jgi:hypothetical protein
MGMNLIPTYRSEVCDLDNLGAILRLKWISSLSPSNICLLGNQRIVANPLHLLPGSLQS